VLDGGAASAVGRSALLPVNAPRAVDAHAVGLHPPWGRTRRGEAEFCHVIEVQTLRFGDTEGDHFRVALRTARDVVPLLSTSDENEAMALAQTVRLALQV